MESTDEITRLRKENEKLKKQVQKGKDFVRFSAKASDAILVIMASVIYFLSVHFISTLAVYGVASYSSIMPIESIFFFYLSSLVILYTLGIFYVVTELCNIFYEELTRFAMWLKVSLFPGKKPKKSTKKKTTSKFQPRTPDGKFAKNA